MKKSFFVLFVFIISLSSFAQKERVLKLNEETNLIEVTYYHDNGVISQMGTYTLDGKLQGEWLSFDNEGNKTVLANYDNGKKVGKWYYWTKDSVKEVDYNTNVIANLRETDINNSQ